MIWRPSVAVAAAIAVFAASAARAEEPASIADPASSFYPGAGPLGADEPPQKPKSDKWDASFWARGRFTALSNFPLDTAGTRSDQQVFLETRLRAAGAWTPTAALAVRIEVDALSGIAAGNLTALGTARGEDTFRYRIDRYLGLDPIELRQLYFSLATPVGEVRFGRQAFRWGLGMLANDGEGEPEFGDHRYGDLLYRLSFAGKPFSWWKGGPAPIRDLVAFAAADFVHRDAWGDDPRGDTSFQGVFGLRTSSRRISVGLLEIARFQRDREAKEHPEFGRSRVVSSTTDAWVSLLLAETQAGAVRVEAEGAVILGSTTRSFALEARRGASLRGLGGVARVRYDDPTRRFTLKSEMGYASGDNDPYDDVAGTFSFHPDYKVGLLLFDQVLPRLAARAIDRLASPSFPGVPSMGLRHFATQGSVTNAVYWNPTIRWRPVPGADVRAGYLLAWSAGDFIDPYSSAKIGGYNATYGGRSPGSHALGHEVDLAVRYRVRLYRDLAVRGGLEGGLFIPGAAFRGVNGDAGMGLVWMGRALLDVTW